MIFDSIRFFSQRTNVEIDSITPEGFIIQETRDAFLKFHRCVRHKDSIFEYIYVYDSKAFLEKFYQRYIYSCNDYPAGYIIYYNKKGIIEYNDPIDIIGYWIV